MPDLNININKDSGMDAENPQNPISVGETPNKIKEPGKKSFGQNAVGAALVQAGKQMVVAGLNQYGNLTGDYTTQRAMQNATRITGDIATVARYGAAGAVMVAANLGIEAFSSWVNMENVRREENMRRQRAGAISIKGSRY